MQLHLSVGFSFPIQASFFLICTSDSTGTGIKPSPGSFYKGRISKKGLFGWLENEDKKPLQVMM